MKEDDLLDIEGIEDDSALENTEKEQPASQPARQEDNDITFNVYEAKPGDTLLTIAEKFYSDSSRWEEIWKYNKYIKDPMALFPGDSVIIPMKVLKVDKEIKSQEMKEVNRKLEKKREKQEFVAGDVDYDGSIIGVKDANKMMHVADDIVFIDIGSADGVKAADRFVIYREKDEYAKKVGLLEIKGDVSENDATAKIIRSIEPIQIGDFILKKK